MWWRRHGRSPIRRFEEVIMKRLIAMAVAPAAVAAIVAGCGGGSSYGGSSNAASSGGGGAEAAIAVRTTQLGPTLVDSAGRTLYLFEKDTSAASMCAGACASIWPPLVTNGKPKAGAGISAAKLGTTKRADGKLEVTYAGHPLYYYVADTKPGELSGEGLDQFGATWDIVAPSGKGVDKG
jgi:predicted lipoprotein with Yx(FWY)xxD motif